MMDGKFVRLSANTDHWRNILAIVVFAISALGVTILAAIIVSPPETTVADKKDIFNILVPVLSTWVGTILAFYFAKDNFEAASRNAQQIVSQLTPEQRLQQTGVRQTMMAKADIKGITLEAAGDQGVPISKIVALIAAGSSRIPVFASDGSLKYTLHEGTVHSCLNKALVAIAGGAAPASVKLAQANATLADLLAEPTEEKGKSIKVSDLARRFAIVRIDANLADARAAMLAVAGARDVFVTETGKASDPVRGWLTNNDITSNVTVS